MNIFSKIKSYFKKPEVNKRSLSQVFQDYLRIRAELQFSDVKLNGNINFKVNYHGSIVPFWLAVDAGVTEETANPKIQNALNMIAVGLALNLNLVEISQALTTVTK